MDAISYPETIQAAYDTLSSTEKALPDRLLGSGCGQFSARELARECGCSAATVVRFARLQGYTKIKLCGPDSKGT